MPPTASSCGRSRPPSRTSSPRIDGKGLVTVNEDVVLKEVEQDLSHLPDLCRRPRLAEGAYNPRSNVMFMPLSQSLHRFDVAHRSRGLQPQFVYNTTNVGKFPTGKDKVGRIDAISVETGRTLWSWETRVANYSPILATGGGLLFNGSMDRYLRALDADNGQVVVADAASFASRRRRRHLFGQRPPVCRDRGRRRRDRRSAARHDAGGGHDASGSNAMYVFALPQ